MLSVEYAALAKNVEKYAGKQFMERGKVMAFTDYDGRACALVCVDNPAIGKWYDPVWVVLNGDEEIAEGNIVSFYLVGEGLSMPVDGVYTIDGQAAEAPVAQAKFISDVSESK